MIRLSYRAACAWVIVSMVTGTAAYNIGIQAGRPTVVHVEDRRRPWDLTDPYERCLLAMEAAEVPESMWECRQAG